jgi:hypothetical protein
MYRRHVMFRALGPYVVAPCIIGESKTRLAMPVLLIYPLDQRGQFILFYVVFTSFPPSHHGSVWLLPVISLLLAKTVSPVRACLIIWRERFRGNQKEDDRGPLSIQSSLLWMIHEYTCVSISLDGSYIYTIHTVLSIVPQISASFSLSLSPWIN